MIRPHISGSWTAKQDWEEESPTLDRDRLLTPDRSQLQVTPLSQATLPRTCYIVIDKFAELIVRPLKDFADLGQIPGEEIQQRTLPIFDNHRVAKRFSNQRTQRVIKVPDSKVFHKTCHHLRMKGITRLLVEGGPSMWRSFADQGLADEVILFMANGAAGAGAEQQRAVAALAVILGNLTLSLTERRVLGPDTLWRFRLGSA